MRTTGLTHVSSPSLGLPYWSLIFLIPHTYSISTCSWTATSPLLSPISCPGHSDFLLSAPLLPLLPWFQLTADYSARAILSHLKSVSLTGLPPNLRWNFPSCQGLCGPFRIWMPSAPLYSYRFCFSSSRSHISALASLPYIVTLLKTWLLELSPSNSQSSLLLLVHFSIPISPPQAPTGLPALWYPPDSFPFLELTTCFISVPLPLSCELRGPGNLKSFVFLSPQHPEWDLLHLYILRNECMHEWMATGHFLQVMLPYFYSHASTPILLLSCISCFLFLECFSSPHPFNWLSLYQMEQRWHLFQEAFQEFIFSLDKSYHLLL